MDYQSLLDDIILTLIREGGSDIHLSSGRVPYIRVNKQLIPLKQKKESTYEDMIGFLTVMLGKAKLEAFLKEQEVDYSYAYKNTHRLRGNAFIQKGNISMALRLIPEVKTLDQLGLPEVLKVFARKKQGFFLVVGPVGQGKSTTLSAMIELINQERAEHIVTIEDPIEHIYQPKLSIIDQREIGIDSHSFEKALISVFREDVNVILLGEMRSAESMATAVTAAETGHLVFSTLHTNNASQTIDRIIDAFPAAQQDQIRIQLSNSLLGIFSQRLIPRISGGLVPAYELLINNNAVANLIREKRTHEIDVVIETSFEQGMIDMNRCLLDLVRRGEITMESAYQFSVNPKALENLL